MIAALSLTSFFQVVTFSGFFSVVRKLPEFVKELTFFYKVFSFISRNKKKKKPKREIFAHMYVS